MSQREEDFVREYRALVESYCLTIGEDHNGLYVLEDVSNARHLDDVRERLARLTDRVSLDYWRQNLNAYPEELFPQPEAFYAPFPNPWATRNQWASR